jgi:aminopeptidase YwaD
MTSRSTGLCAAPAVLASLVVGPAASAQPGPPPPLPKTPLKQEVLSLLANEVSGQMAFNNEVLLAGAPRLREAGEFAGTMFEAQRIYDLVKGYGIETTRIERYPSARTFDYPVEGELWQIEPERRLVGRLGADAALVATGSSTADVTGELIYVPPLSSEDAKRMAAGGVQERYRGKLALMWSHAREETAKALDAAGVVGVISFSSRERYADPNQVVYGGGSYKNAGLKVGLNVSWRQWSELLEDVLSGRRVVVRAKTRIETHPDRFEAVYSWIPGTEPDAKGVIFTAHLFEGYVKRGANDDMSGCVVQLEILRALNRLIASGELPRPRRTIYFLWPNEISGTYEFIKQHPGIADTWSININMDMVGEWLRKNNALMTMSECPDHLPCYLDGLAASLMNYVWRTNDIVYLPDAPRGRPGGQYFPLPMVEKNGSDDAFRFFTHRATGGSDHICFNNPSVAVPGIELFTWPDQWYHADTDTPDKSDPTQMKRIAFIGAASAWAAASCTDEVLQGLLDAVSDFGYRRVAERDLPKALRLVEAADAAGLRAAVERALNQVEVACDREADAVRSVEGVYSGSAAAKTLVGERARQWELYRTALRGQIEGYARVRAGSLGAPAPAAAARPRDTRPPAPPIVPALAAAVKGREFSLTGFQPYADFLKANPDALKTLGLTPALANAILNYVNGRRSAAVIRNAVAAETGQEVTREAVAGYLEVLKKVGWVTF